MAPSHELWREVNYEALAEQAQEFELLAEDTLSKVYKFFLASQMTHPWVIIRTKEIKEWVDDGEYDTVLNLVKNRPEESTPSPGQPVAGAQVCATCGKPLNYIAQYKRWYCYNCKKYQ